MVSKRAWSCSSSPAAVAAAAASMIQLRVSFLEEEDWKGDKGKANKTVTQSLLEQNAAAHGALWAGPFWKGESPENTCADFSFIYFSIFVFLQK